MRLMQKTIATLLIICMMFSLMPMQSGVFDGVYENVFAGGALGNSGNPSSKPGNSNGGGGYLDGTIKDPSFRVTLSRNQNVRVNADENSATYKELIQKMSFQYAPFSKGTDVVNDTLFFIPRYSSYPGDGASYPHSLYKVGNSAKGGYAYYTGSPLSGMYKLTEYKYQALMVEKNNQTSKPTNVFKDKVVAAYNAKTITSTTDLSNFGWNKDEYKPTKAQAQAMLNYILQPTAGMQQRVLDVTDDNFNKPIETLNNDEQFKVAVGYGGLLVSLYVIAEHQGATAVADSYATALNDYFGNNDLDTKPVTIMIDVCMAYRANDLGYSITPCIDLLEFALATETTGSITEGDTFYSFYSGYKPGTTRQMVEAMAKESLDVHPFQTSYGWIKGSNDSSTKQIYRISDRNGEDWDANKSLDGTAIGRTYSVWNLGKLIWTSKNGPYWKNNSRSGYLDLLYLNYDGGIDGYMLIGNQMSNPAPKASYYVNDSLMTTDNPCTDVVKITNDAQLTVTLGMSSDFMSFLDQLPEDTEVIVESSITRSEYLNSLTNAPVDVKTGGYASEGGAVDPEMGKLQDNLDKPYTVADFIEASQKTFTFLDTSIKDHEPVQKELNGNKLLIWKYDVNVRIKINEEFWEFKADNIVKRSGGVPLNTAQVTIPPMKESTSFCEDVEIIKPTDPQTTEVINPSEKENLAYNTRMIRRYEYTSTVGKSVAANGVADVNDANVAAFAELKSNSPLQEEWEVLAGIPSSEEIYFSIGGSEYKVAMILQYWMNEHSRDRTYTIHFDGTKCEHNNEETGDRMPLKNPVAVPGDVGSWTDNEIHCLNEAGTGGFDGTIIAEWSGNDKGTCKPVMKSCNCGTQLHDKHEFTHPTYDSAKKAAEDLVAALNAEQVKWKGSSDALERIVYWEASITTDDYDWDDDTTPGDSGKWCGTHGHGSGDHGSGSNKTSCGSGNHTVGSACSNGHTWHIVVTAKIPDHAVCGPCCGHHLPDLYDTWRQGLVYDYAKISQIRLYLLDQGSVDGLTELVGSDRIMANIVSGNPTYFMNIAQMTEQENPFYTVRNGETLKDTGDDFASKGQGSGMTFYGSSDGVYQGVNGNFNRWEAQSSRAGRLRYVLDPTNVKPPARTQTSKIGTQASFTLDPERVANPIQHDDVIYTIGTRSAICDGMSNHYNFGKAGTSVEPVSNIGHQNEWGQKGCLYTNILEITDYSTYHELTSFGNTYDPKELKENDANVSKYKEDYNHHVERTSGVTKTSYSDKADQYDIKTAEWQIFDDARRTKVIVDVISDFLIIQTSGGDQSLFYFEKVSPGTEAQEHFQKVKATQQEMFTDNPLSVFKAYDGECADICNDADGSSSIKGGIQGFEIIGGYNGRYDRPADKYKPYSNVTKQFLDFYGSWGKYTATYREGNWTSIPGGNYNPHGETEIITIFDKDPAGTITRPERQATSQETSFKIYQDNIQILPTAPNKFYQPTNAMVWYSQVMALYSPDSGAMDMEMPGNGLWVGAAKQVDLGWAQRSKYGPDWFETWGTSIGLEISTKYYLTEDGDSNTGSINGVVVYTPVSTEKALVLPQGNLDIGYVNVYDKNGNRKIDDEEKGVVVSRDQRVNGFDYPNMNDMVNRLKVCSLDPATCEYRYLDCKYLHETVLASFNFEPKYMGTVVDVSGNYPQNLKPEEKDNTFKSGDRYVTTNLITGKQYTLPEGYTIKDSGFGTGSYLSATGETAWSLPFSDLGLSSARNNRVKVSMDLKVNATSDNVMVVGFKNIGFIINANTGASQFISPDEKKVTMVGTSKDLNTNIKDVKLEIIFGFNNIIDCTAYVGGIEADVSAVKDYRTVWKTTTNAQNFETRQQVTEMVTLSDKEIKNNPPEDLRPGDISGYLNIGTWNNPNSTYKANYYIDNLDIILMGGTTEHTSACYTTTTVHTSSRIHVCDDKCYLKEDVYSCDGELNAGYEVRPDFVPSQGSQTWTSATTFTLPGTGTYTIELYGEKGDSPSKTGGNGGHVKGTFTGTKGQTLKIEVAAGGGSSGRQGGNAPVVYLDGTLLAIAGGGGSGSSCSSGYNGYSAGQWQTASSAAINGSGYTGGDCSGCGAGGGAGYQPGQGSDDYTGHGYYAGGGTNYVGGLNTVSINKGSDSSNLGDSTETTIRVILTYDLGPQGTPGLDYPNGDYTVPTVHKHDNTVKILTCQIPEGNDGTTYNFTYKGSIESVDLPAGRYKLEVWGARGNGSGTGGGYSRGETIFTTPTKVYIGVGGAGKTFNGGGTGNHGTGGGATHIGLKDGVLSGYSSDYSTKLLIVAGGAGGSNSGTGGYGGGANSPGGTATNGGCGSPGTGGTLSNGGTNSYSNVDTSYVGKVNFDGSFGTGGSGGRNSVGGGGGFYGGGASYEDYSRDDSDDAGGGGGSGYANTAKVTSIYGEDNNNKADGKATITRLEHTHTESCYTTTTHTCPKIPAGTYVCTGELNTNSDLNTHVHNQDCLTDYKNLTPTNFFYTGNMQTYKAPYTDYYKFEVYGAGTATVGYASGVTKLKAGTTVYVYVGGTDGFNNFASDVRFVKSSTIPANIPESERDTYEKGNEVSLASRLMTAGATKESAEVFNIMTYPVTDATIKGMGGSGTGRVVITPLNRLPMQNGQKTILNQILDGDIPETQAQKYLGKELADVIINKAQVFKTWSNFSWTNYQGFVKDSNLISFANSKIISRIENGVGGWEFHVPVNIEAKSLRQVRITLDNNTNTTTIGVGINGGQKEVTTSVEAKKAGQVITIPVSDKWWNDNITSLYFDLYPGTPNETGTIEVSKIELIGHANLSATGSGYGYTELKTINNFSTSDTKGFTVRNNATISYNGSNMRVTATGSDPITDWNTIDSIAADAVKAIKIVFTNNSGAETHGQLFYKSASLGEAEDNSFLWNIGATASEQTIWIDTVNKTAYNATTGSWYTKGTQTWTGNITGMRFDWGALASGSIDVKSITFIGNGSASGTGSYTMNLICGLPEGANNLSQTFDYTGGIQTIDLPSGRYTLEVWGAQGGSVSDGGRGNGTGGLGGYSKGEINLTTATKLYIVVGGQGMGGTGGNSTGTSYNGGGVTTGGRSNPSAGGGGATHIAERTGLLSSLSSYKSDVLIVAGGGGGASHVGYGGSGGGETGGKPVATETYSQIGYTTGGTQTGGGGGGQSSTTTLGSFGQGATGYASAGGGGGWYGGGTTHDSSYFPAAGGSGYIGGVENGSMTSGQRSGNGYAKISGLTHTHTSSCYTGTQSKVTITASTPSTTVTTAQYKNPFENKTTAQQTIFQNVDKIPEYVDGDYNPIFICKFEGFNTHDCVNCTISRRLDCTEPHHKGGVLYDKDGNLIKDDAGRPVCKEHYSGANKICWSACGDDSKHKNTETEITVQNGDKTETLRLADFLQIDEGFTIYFPNVGDFYGNGALGISSAQLTRGYGYKDNMDTTRWTREKRVKFPFDVIYDPSDEAKAVGAEMAIYEAGYWIELYVPDEYFNFYILVSNPERSNAKVEFECEAINCGTAAGLQAKAGISYTDRIGTIYQETLDNFLDNYLQNWYDDILDGGYIRDTAQPNENTTTTINTSALTSDIKNFGYMDFYVTKQEEEAQAFVQALDYIDTQVEKDFEGTDNDYIDPHHIGSAGDEYDGINQEVKEITYNDNKIRFDNAMRSNSLQHLHGGYKSFYLDVIGRIGNFAVVDTEDFRFSNFFKTAIVSDDDTAGLADPNNWLVEGLVKEVDDSVQNFYVGDLYDLRGNKASINNRWLDTYGTQSWMAGQLIGAGRDVTKPNLVSQILTGEVNNIEVLKQEQLRYGYDIYTSLVTFGSYESGQVQVVPKYYALKVTDKKLDGIPDKYNVPKGYYLPIDIYINKDGVYAPVNVFGNSGNGNPNKGDLKMDDYVFNVDWTVEGDRRNYSLEEIARTNRVKEFFKEIVYDMSSTNSDETMGGRDVDVSTLPILDVIEYVTPEGATNYLGTAQYILMNARHRTFIGSSSSYDNNAGGKAIWNSRAGESIFKVDKGDYPNGYNLADTRPIDEIQFERSVQRWHGKIGLPSSAVFVPHGEEVNGTTLEYIMGENQDEWVIVCTAEMIAMGAVWNIYYSQPWFNTMTINGVDFETSEHYPGHRVPEDPDNPDGPSKPCPNCLDPIIAVFGKTSVDDVEIIQIY